MTIKNFITKGILPILLIGIITWLGQYIFMVDGSIDWFRFMLVYCKAGKIDLIVTKSVSRFARNIVDCIAKVRELANMIPQVGVFFETEHIYTLDNTSEMMLAVLSAAAQEESHTKSEIMNISIKRFCVG